MRRSTSIILFLGLFVSSAVSAGAEVNYIDQERREFLASESLAAVRDRLEFIATRYAGTSAGRQAAAILINFPVPRPSPYVPEGGSTDKRDIDARPVNLNEKKAKEHDKNAAKAKGDAAAAAARGNGCRVMLDEMKRSHRRNPAREKTLEDCIEQANREAAEAYGRELHHRKAAAQLRGG